MLGDLQFRTTAALFEGKSPGIDIPIFVVRTPPGRAIEIHHPYSETFVLLAGHSAGWSGRA